MMKRFSLLAVLALSTCAGAAQAAQKNDYPTVAISDYVFGCMATNGQTRQALEQCSCSIDVIASIMPYGDYEQAETTMSVRQIGGEKAAIFKSSAHVKDMLHELRRAQAEAEIRCF